jgi:hypothetical protein
MWLALSFVSRPLCSSWKQLSISIELEVGWTSEFGRFGEYINSMPLTGIRPRSLGLSGRTVVTIPITLSRSCVIKLSKHSERYQH